MTFRRRNGAKSLPNDKSVLPAGVRVSSLGYKQTSTGHTDLDETLDGGLSLGSITLVIQDTPTAYYQSFPFSYFFGQGIAHGHATAIVTVLTPALTIFQNLPSLTTKSVASSIESSKSNDEVAPRIAWRYYKSKDAEVVSRSSYSQGKLLASTSYSHRFDLSKPLNIAPPSSSPVSLLGLYNSLDATTLLQDLTSHASYAQDNKLPCRIGILDTDLLHLTDFPGGLLGFVWRLKKLAKKYEAVVMVGVRDKDGGLDAIADVCINLESFGGRGTGVAGLSEGLMVVGVERGPGDGRLKCVKNSAWVAKRGRRKWSLESAAGGVQDDGDGEGVDFEKGRSKKSIDF